MLDGFGFFVLNKERRALLKVQDQRGRETLLPFKCKVQSNRKLLGGSVGQKAMGG